MVVFTWPVLSSTTSIATSASPEPQSIPSAALSYQIHVKRINLTGDNRYPEVASLQTGLDELTI